MSLKKRTDLQAMGYEGELRIADTERASQRPFGEINQKGRFKFKIEKVPFYNIPDLTGFNVSFFKLSNLFSLISCCPTSVMLLPRLTSK